LGHPLPKTQKNITISYRFWDFLSL